MTSVLAGAMFFVAMSYIGLIVKNQYKLRHEFIKGMSQFVNYALREIIHYKTPINAIIDKFVLTNETNIKAMMVKYKELEINKTYQDVYDISNYLYLKKSDRLMLSEYLFNAGKSNYAEEIKRFESFIYDINNLERQAKEALDKEGKLYFQLLSLVGLALMIIVV